MWRYEQNTGRLYNPGGTLVVTGYSGAWDGTHPVGNPNDHRNRSADQAMHALGPVPVGLYDIGPAANDTGKGPLAMHLVPRPDNRMYGRSGFMVHGDRSPPRSGTASEGCIIMPRNIRQLLADSTDRVLAVVRS